jgi:hypothetical protein
MIGLKPHPMDFPTLSNKIEQRLCELGQLVPNQFPMTQREVVQGGKTVGVYFCVHGPRSVKLTAICDLIKRVVVFYGTDGLRRDSMPISVGGRMSAAA